MNQVTSVVGTSRFAVAAAAAALLAGCGSGTHAGGGASHAGGERAAALAAFERVRVVLQSPRCQNCHPAGDTPLQGDDGKPHDQAIRRGPDGRGLPGAECITCHREANPPASYGEHMPPGVATGWRMPRPDQKLVFEGVAPRALCEQLTDPARNGGMDAAALRHHLDDPLVAWGWSPGTGRSPVPVPRAELVVAWEYWAAAGAPCPE